MLKILAVRISVNKRLNFSELEIHNYSRKIPWKQRSTLKAVHCPKRVNIRRCYHHHHHHHHHYDHRYHHIIITLITINITIIIITIITTTNIATIITIIITTSVTPYLDQESSRWEYGLLRWKQVPAEVRRRPEGPAFGVLSPHNPDHSFVLQSKRSQGKITKRKGDLTTLRTGWPTAHLCGLCEPTSLIRQPWSRFPPQHG